MKTYIGIDPSFRDGGFALCYLVPTVGEKSQGSGYAVRFEKFPTYADFVEWMFQYKLYRVADRERQLVFCIEDSILQNCTFDKSGNKAVAARKSRNVGMNQAASKLCGSLIEKYAPLATIVRLSPFRKGQKMTHDGFVQHVAVSGYKPPIKKTTNQDERDAYKLAVHVKARNL